MSSRLFFWCWETPDSICNKSLATPRMPIFQLYPLQRTWRSEMHHPTRSTIAQHMQNSKRRGNSRAPTKACQRHVTQCLPDILCNRGPLWLWINSLNCATQVKMTLMSQHISKPALTGVYPDLFFFFWHLLWCKAFWISDNRITEPVGFTATLWTPQSLWALKR